MKKCEKLYGERVEQYERFPAHSKKIKMEAAEKQAILAGLAYNQCILENTKASLGDNESRTRTIFK